MKRAIFFFLIAILFNGLLIAKSMGNQKSVDKYQILLEKLSESNYMVVRGKVVREHTQSTSTLFEEKEIDIIRRALDAIKSKISIPEGAKVIIQSDNENNYVVIFENKLPEGALGSDYSAKVTIDSKSGKVLEILLGS